MTFNEWHKDNAKYMEPTDIVAWCQAAYKAGAAAERDAMKPRRWTEEMRHAWHQSIPDLELAFDELIRARGQE